MGWRYRLKELSWLAGLRVQVGWFALALATALIHAYLAIPLTIVPFYLNGVGYVVLVVMLYLPRFRGRREGRVRRRV